MKFRAVHKLLLENQYDVLMVDAGAKNASNSTIHHPSSSENGWLEAMLVFILILSAFW